MYNNFKFEPFHDRLVVMSMVWKEIKMKRTKEKTFVWIGVGLSILYSVIMFMGSRAFSNKEVLEELKPELEKSAKTSGLTVDQFITATEFSSKLIAVGSIVTAVIAIMAILIVKQRRVLAGILLIIAVCISVVSSNLIAGLLWLIAAIMLFVRKTPAEVKQQTTHDDNDLTPLDGQDAKAERTEVEQEKKKKDDPYIY